MVQSKSVTILLQTCDDTNADSNRREKWPRLALAAHPNRLVRLLTQFLILLFHNKPARPGPSWDPSYPHNISHYSVLIFEMNFTSIAAHYIK